MSLPHFDIAVLSLCAAALTAVVPLSFMTAAALSRAHAPWSALVRATHVAALAAVGAAVAWAFAAGAPHPSQTLVAPGAATAVMLLLASVIGVVTSRVARSSLSGDARALGTARAFAAVLAAITTLIATRNLWVVAAAWTAMSIGLDQLLTHFNDRAQAQLAARKNFLVSRLADACMWSAVALLAADGVSLDLAHIDAAVRAGPLTATREGAALLIVAAVCLRSAQLPFHGWIIRVMEAPTVVSALLHAGVVNIGGLVLFRVAGLISSSTAASAVLVVVGALTAAVATLVMTTRVSVKVSLAWSTVGQMGIMIVQCGLGLWHLALLHAVAHALYKAHAFLTAGETVRATVVRMQADPATRGLPSLRRELAIAAICVSVAAALGAAASGGELRAAGAVLALVLGLAVTPFFLRVDVRAPVRLVSAVGRAAGVWVLVLVGHQLSAVLWGAAPEAPEPGLWAYGLLSTLLVGVTLAQAVLLRSPSFAARVHPMLFAGFYLDDVVTRLTLRLAPPRLPVPVGRRTLPHTYAAHEG